MKKIAIFTEGQTEQIFVRSLLTQVIGWDKISFVCLKLYADNLIPVPYDYLNEHALVYFLFVNTCGDEKVLSAIKEREKFLIQKGFDKIIALRDMYSNKYYNRAGSTINDTITEEFIKGSQDTIQEMSSPDIIKLYFAIMELEAWFLGMYNIFERIDSSLQTDYIKENLGYDLRVINPQTEFFKPADIVHKIYQLAGKHYKKSRDDVENICSKMSERDFDNAVENGRCTSFKDFFCDVINIKANLSQCANSD